MGDLAPDRPPYRSRNLVAFNRVVSQSFGGALVVQFGVIIILMMDHDNLSVPQHVHNLDDVPNHVVGRSNLRV